MSITIAKAIIILKISITTIMAVITTTVITDNSSKIASDSNGHGNGTK